ncbi:PIG-L family deacetylase [Aliarcobacter cryaerophilus]|uniref:PIG-L family deacetylase n=1 Tax=Aliarcobacter cryaerophilus TaxID=28198 RepID=UPI0021B54AB8|nr:PIG-L family deacetylase [Aliarcobacter cryaerophilus]MCT7539510.1 PIG-L family deacetylase [Aliarcobacter cryaerophilus]
MIFIYIAIFFLSVLFIMYILIRSRNKMYKYNQKQDYIYDFKNPKIFEIENIDLKEFKNNETLILKLNIKSNFLSKLYTPYIEVISSNKKEKTFFEHSAKGIRYIDISSFCGAKIKLNPIYLSINNKQVEIYSFNNINIENKKVLIISPHADDAEIASFGLYSSAKESFIVTVTAGEGGSKYCNLESNKSKQALLKGNLRVFNALTTGVLGGVKHENSIVLGYFTESIKKMFEAKASIIPSKSADIEDVNYFRRVEHSKIVTNPNACSKWESLVEDFVQILGSINPDFIFTLHPQIDSHPDHQYITLALIEAMDKLEHKNTKLLTNTNHLTYNEIYPYGKMFSTLALAPSFLASFLFDEIYSHRLTKEQQIYKYYALETMHDLRDSTIQIGLKKPFVFAFRQLRRYINGKEQSYYRRAVKTNEIFYIIDSQKMKEVFKEIIK